MLLKKQLNFVFSFILLVSCKDIILKLDSKQIIDSIISESSVKYLTKLAQVFAKEAAESFIKEIKNKENLLLKDTNRTNSLPVSKKPFYKFRVPSTTTKTLINEEILKEDEAYKLLEKPSPDGDHLGWHSQEVIIDEEDRKETTKVPAYGLMKVNGVYVRRLLGLDFE